jgi:hypothetical protein
MMKMLAPVLLLLAAACQSTMERAPSTWYARAELVCHDQGCFRCRGSSHHGCAPCRASGGVPCNRCRDGTERCGVCKGDGSKDGKKCKACKGDGKRDCSTCGGDRVMACPTCLGRGQVCCLRPLVISEPIPRGPDAWPQGNEPPQ